MIKSADPNIDFGAIRSEISTHSIRKTADTLAVNQPCGPEASVVRTRAGHSNGKVQDCYQKDDPSGDCFCGRVLSMEPMTTPDFALLPPHFNAEGLLEIKSIGWENLLPGYSTFDDRFKRSLPMLLAVIVYHYKKGNLEKLLPAEHPIFIQPLIAMKYCDRLFPHIRLGIYKCTETNMVATGVSPFVITLIQIENTAKESREQIKKFGEKLDVLTTEVRK